MTEIAENATEFSEKPSDDTDEDGYDVLRVLPKYIGDIWSHIIPFLLQGMQANPTLNIQQISDGLVDQSIQLWIVVPSDRKARDVGPVRGCFLTSIERDRGEWVLSLFSLGGQDARHWVKACHEAVHRFARFEDCARVRMAGRKAWQRLLPAGYEVVGEKDGHLIYEKAVEE